MVVRASNYGVECPRFVSLQRQTFFVSYPITYFLDVVVA